MEKIDIIAIYDVPPPLRNRVSNNCQLTIWLRGVTTAPNLWGKRITFFFKIVKIPALAEMDSPQFLSMVAFLKIYNR